MDDRPISPPALIQDLLVTAKGCVGKTSLAYAAAVGITPYAWVVNQSLTPTTVTDPLLRARRGLEAGHEGKVEGLGTRVCLVPWRAEAPAGRGALLGLVITAPEPQPPTLKATETRRSISY